MTSERPALLHSGPSPPKEAPALCPSAAFAAPSAPDLAARCPHLDSSPASHAVPERRAAEALHLGAAEAQPRRPVDANIEEEQETVACAPRGERELLIALLDEGKARPSMGLGGDGREQLASARDTPARHRSPKVGLDLKAFAGVRRSRRDPPPICGERELWASGPVVGPDSQAGAGAHCSCEDLPRCAERELLMSLLREGGAGRGGHGSEAERARRGEELLVALLDEGKTEVAASPTGQVVRASPCSPTEPAHELLAALLDKGKALSSPVCLDGPCKAEPAAGSPVILVMRNLPARSLLGDLLGLLQQSGFAGKFEYLYLPLKPHCASKNRGFAFVSFADGQQAARFNSAVDGAGMPGRSSEKLISVEVANVQLSRDQLWVTSVKETPWGPVLEAAW